MGLRLISVHMTSLRKKFQIRILADAEDHNITIAECAALSRTAGDFLDSYPHEFPDYKLEVSSPGLNTALKDWQVKKNIGHKVTVKYRADGKHQRIEGTLNHYENGTVVISTESQEQHFELKTIEGLYVQPEF
ncbi:hypothetical protein KJ564_13325 [bacterium]|nr:hypothetical protein [bacterium]